MSNAVSAALILMVMVAAFCSLMGYAAGEEVEKQEAVSSGIVILTPQDGSAVYDNVKVVARFEQCDCAGNTPCLKVNGVFYENGTFVPTEHSERGWDTYVFYWNGNLFTNGNYTLTVVGKHPELMENITVELRNTELTGYKSTYLAYPPGGTGVSDEVTVTAYVQLCNCSPECALYVDGEKKADMPDTGSTTLVCGSWFFLFTYTLDTSGLSAGKHDLKVISHHGSEDSASIYVNNTGSPGGDENGEEEENEEEENEGAGGDDDEKSDNGLLGDGGDSKESGFSPVFAGFVIALAVIVMIAIAVIAVVLVMKTRRSDRE